jgi:uncharacterized protein (UPF0335 family)
MPTTAKIPGKGPALRVVKDASAAPNTPNRELFHFYIGQIEKQNASVKEVQKVRKEVRRQASDAGLNLEILDTLIRKREKEPDTVNGWLGTLITQSRWMGMAPEHQGDLFEAAAAKESIEARLEDEGYVDGLEGRDTDTEGRYNPTTPEGQARMKGWYRGQKILQEQFLAKT